MISQRTSYVGMHNSLPANVRHGLGQEKLAARWGAAWNQRYQFLPWLDDMNGETEEHVEAYMEMYRRDDTVNSAVNEKVLAVAALDWNLHPQMDTPRNQMGADFLLWNYQQCDGGTAQLVEELLVPLIVKKYCVCEKVWRPEPVQIHKSERWMGRRVLRCLKAREWAKYEEDAWGRGPRGARFGSTRGTS